MRADFVAAEPIPGEDDAIERGFSMVAIGIDVAADAATRRAARIAWTLAAAAYITSLLAPWIRLHGNGGSFDVTALGGVGGSGTGVYTAYLITVPALLGIGLAAHRWPETLSKIVVGMAIVPVIAVTTLLKTRSVVVLPGDPISTMASPRLGFWFALATPILAAASALLLHRAFPAVCASAATLVLGLTTLVAAIAVPWGVQTVTDFRPDPVSSTARVFIADLSFGSLFLTIATVLCGLVAATVVTRSSTLRVASLSLAIAWLAIHLLTVVAPNRITFHSGRVEPRPGLFLGFVAISLLGAAAWLTPTPARRRRAPPYSPYASTFAVAAFGASILAPWITVPDERATNLNLAGTHIGLLDFPGEFAGTLVLSALLLTMAVVAAGTTAVVTGSGRWFTVGTATALLALSATVIQSPHKLLDYFEYDTTGTSVAAGAVIAMIAAVGAIVAVTLPPSTRSHPRPAGGRTMIATAGLAVTAVAALVALLASWATIRHTYSDNAEFPGDISVSPFGAVFVTAGAMLLAGAMASTFSQHRDVWRPITMTYAAAVAVLLLVVHHRPELLGYGYPAAVTVRWHAGWSAALIATIAALATAAMAPPSGAHRA